MIKQQLTDTIMMIRPANFGFNPETAESNAFQTNIQDLSSWEIRELAKTEFDAMVDVLRKANIDIIVIEDDEAVIKTDAVFPNNWVSFHGDGTVVTYPMLSKVRRHERREDILELLGQSFKINKRLHLEGSEDKGMFLEGTGSLIFDRPNKLAYACVSPRTNPELLQQFCAEMGFNSILFKAVDLQGQEIYHTNVMMNIGETFAVICLECIPDANERSKVSQSLKDTGKEIIEITQNQVLAFAGNMLEVKNKSEERILVMSASAKGCLRMDQLTILEKHTQILSCEIPTIEKYGGGSARCMMAEVFLPRL
jgi:hypothetical protein